MALHLVLSAVAIVAVALLATRAAGQDQYPWTVCGTTGYITAKSKYLANLDLIAATLPKNASASPDLFATAEDVGAIPDQVSALGLCRGDSNATSCFSCLAQAFRDLPNTCAYSKDAVIYYDSCMLYYSNVHFTADDSWPALAHPILYDVNITLEPARFNRVVAALVNATADYAAYNSTRRYASGEADFDQEVIPKVYSWAQCTPDLTPARCRGCLARRIADDMGWFTNALGASALGIAFGIRCSFRYQTTPFLVGPMMVQLPRPSPSPGAPTQAPAAVVPTVNVTTTAAAAEAGGGGSKGNTNKKILIIVLCVPITVFCSMLLGSLLLIRRLRKGAGKKKLLQPQAHCRNSSKTEEALKLWKIEESSTDFTLYDFSELADATDNFSEENRLGRGGFGPVCRGKLPDGDEIAVKRLAAQSGQGLKEFKNEIQLIAKLQHTNLVKLVGCCVQQEEKILVYEYMPNRSLDFIFDHQRGPLLDWKKRQHIIEGIAQGLLYLHKHSRVRIIHRDLKASNILLDKDLNPKISDFGMARIFGSNMTEANTNRVVGTYGYMAPEYASEGIFSVKSDVFSFGVLLLEIVSGKRNSGHQHYGDFVNLLGYAWQLWREGRVFELIDPTLGDCNEVTSIMRCIKVALLCVQDNAMDRPTMTDVTAMLGNDGVVLPDPRRPPHFDLRVTGSCSTNYVTITAIEEGR